MIIINKVNKKFYKKYKDIIKNDSILGKLQIDTMNNTGEDGHSKDKKLSRKYAGLLFNHYESCYKKGEEVEQKYFKFLYFTYSNSYLGMYDTNYYREFHNSKNFSEDRKILKRELILNKLIKENMLNHTDYSILRKQGVIFSDFDINTYWIDTEYNYAHLLYYVGRLIPSIHLSNKILKYLTHGLKLPNEQRIFDTCIVNNLLFYLTLTYLYDTEEINNKYIMHQLIVYANNFLFYDSYLLCNYKKSKYFYKIKSLDFQVRVLRKNMPFLKNTFDKIKTDNKFLKFKSLLIKLFKRDNHSPYESYKFERWVNSNNFGLNISNDFDKKCNRCLTLPHITHDYVHSLEHKYIFALYQYFIGLKKIKRSYQYSIDLMRSSFGNLYSVLDMITSDMTIWVNDYSKYSGSNNPLIYMIQKYKDGTYQKKDYSIDYFHTFFTKMRMKHIFNKYGDNSPFQGLYWISKGMDRNNKFCDQNLVDCTDLRNAQMHRFMFIKKNDRDDTSIKFVKDDYHYDNGVATVDFGKFNLLLNHLIYVCRESIILLICFININGRHTTKFITDEIEKYQKEV